MAKPMGRVTKTKPRYITLVSFGHTKQLAKTAAPSKKIATAHCIPICLKLCNSTAKRIAATKETIENTRRSLQLGDQLISTKDIYYHSPSTTHSIQFKLGLVLVYFVLPGIGLLCFKEQLIFHNQNIHIRG